MNDKLYYFSVVIFNKLFGKKQLKDRTISLNDQTGHWNGFTTAVMLAKSPSGTGMRTATTSK